MAEGKKKKSPLVLRIILGVILAVVIVILAASLIARFTGKPLFIFNKSMIWVMTESMEDEIPAQSYILVEKTDGNSVGVGDVVSFYSEDPQIKGSLNTHRIIGVNEDGSFVTKGDHNVVEDEYSVPSENIVARYVRVLPLLSKLGQLFATKLGLAVIIIVVAAVTAVTCIPDFVKASKEKKKEEKSKHDEKIDRLVEEEVERLKSEAKEASVEDDGKSGG